MKEWFDYGKDREIEYVECFITGYFARKSGGEYDVLEADLRSLARHYELSRYNIVVDVNTDVEFDDDDEIYTTYSGQVRFYGQQPKVLGTDWIHDVIGTMWTHEALDIDTERLVN